jgi:hypothetical protein
VGFSALPETDILAMPTKGLHYEVHYETARKSLGLIAPLQLESTCTTLLYAGVLTLVHVNAD